MSLAYTRRITPINDDVELVSYCSLTDDNPLTFRLERLPTRVRSHSVRAGVIAMILAREIAGSDFEFPVFHSALYHHFAQSPKETAALLRDKIPPMAFDCAEIREIILKTVRYCGERFDGSGAEGMIGGEIPVSALCLGFADMLDGMLTTDGHSTKAHIAEVKQNLPSCGERLFGFAVADCFGRHQEEIWKLYRSKRNGAELWKSGEAI
jgi:hypothetical protein